MSSAIGARAFRLVLLSFALGWSEATWFFIIPDVALCFIALSSLRLALVSTAAAVAGALLGAVTLYRFPSARWLDWWLLGPGFRASMVSVATLHMERGAAGLMEGPRVGIPYRLYVWVGARQGVPLRQVLLWTPLARVQRMLLPPLLAWVCQPALGPAAWVLLWLAMYSYYWWVYVPRHYP